MFTHDLSMIGRDKPLFVSDYGSAEATMRDALRNARVLVVGGAGSIGQEVVKLIASYSPAALSIVDSSENNLTELTRDFRSSIGYISGETSFEPLDAAHDVFDAYLNAQKPFDYVLNFSALMHVRSEKDPWSLMRMIETNVLVAKKLLDYADRVSAQKYFCVSTDKAENPANLMGASKRVMECFLNHGDIRRGDTHVSTARFANVAFSDGSLLHGFRQRLLKGQPLSAPRDIRRYFVTGEEAGKLCMMSIFTGQDQEIYFPKLDADKETARFDDIAVKFLAQNGYEAHICDSEDEARAAAKALTSNSQSWPCYFFDSDTTGEKPLEEFYSEQDYIDWQRFEDIGVIKGLPYVDAKTLQHFEQTLSAMRSHGSWDKEALVKLIEDTLPSFSHEEKGKYLDAKM